jgi:hypothetical protein
MQSGPPTAVIVSGVDRDAIARAQRRRQVHEALADERDREHSLQEEFERLIGEAEATRIDEEIFARMSPEDAEVVRAVLPEPVPAELEEEDEEWLEVAGEPSDEGAVEPEDETEAELARLQEELDASRKRQGAFERYLQALDGSAEGSRGTAD